MQVRIDQLAASVRNLDLDTSIAICEQMKDILEKGKAAT